MAEPELKQELESLHDKLEGALRTSAIEKDALGHVMRDIVNIYESQGDNVTDESRSLRETLNDMASDYEVDHPNVAAVIRQILDLLARIGI